MIDELNKAAGDLAARWGVIEEFHTRTGEIAAKMKTAANAIERGHESGPALAAEVVAEAAQAIIEFEKSWNILTLAEAAASKQETKEVQ